MGQKDNRLPVSWDQTVWQSLLEEFRVEVTKREPLVGRWAHLNVPYGDSALYLFPCSSYPSYSPPLLPQCRVGLGWYGLLPVPCQWELFGRTLLLPQVAQVERVELVQWQNALLPLAFLIVQRPLQSAPGLAQRRLFFLPYPKETLLRGREPHTVASRHTCGKTVCDVIEGFHLIIYGGKAHHFLWRCCVFSAFYPVMFSLCWFDHTPVGYRFKQKHLSTLSTQLTFQD